MGWPGFGGWRGSSACSGPLRPSSSRSRSRSRRRGRQRRSRSRWSAGSRRGTRLNLPPPRGPAAPPKEAGGAAGALLSVANIRRWAHVPEFFLQGLFLFGAAALWPQGRHGARRGQGPRGRLLVALAACAACSLFDQVHKAFVPGREFDALDLPFDAAGYLFALLLVVFIAGVRRLWCPVRRERRPLP